MFIQTEQTPNPATLKFLPGRDVMDKGTADFRSMSEAGHSPLAKGLFTIDGVVGVFLGRDFVTVTKNDARDWTTLKPHVLAAMMDHFLTGLPAVNENNAPSNMTSSEGAQEGDSDIIKQIKELIEQRVRPAVAQDGGDITFNRFDEGVVYLNLKGSCAGCPSSTATLKSGIESMLKHYIPEIIEVRQVL